MSNQILASTKPINTFTFHHQKGSYYSPIVEAMPKLLQNTYSLKFLYQNQKRTFIQVVDSHIKLW